MKNGIIESYSDLPDVELRAALNRRFRFKWGYITQFGIVILRDSRAAPDIYEKHYTIVHYHKYPDGTYLLAAEHEKLNLVEIVKLVLGFHNDPNYWAEVFHDGGKVLSIIQDGAFKPQD